VPTDHQTSPRRMLGRWLLTGLVLVLVGGWTFWGLAVFPLTIVLMFLVLRQHHREAKSLAETEGLARRSLWRRVGFTAEVVVALGVMFWATLILSFGLAFGEGEVELPDWAIWLGLVGYPTLSMAAVIYAVRLWARRSATAHILPIAIMIAPLMAPLLGYGEDAMPICSSFVTHEMTGDLETDLVGAWRSRTEGGEEQHPIAHLAGQGEEGDPPQSTWPGRRIWMFRPDGTGHVWWANEGPGFAYANDEEFVWAVTEEKLIVNGLPPAELDVLDEEAFILASIDDTTDRDEGVAMRACELEIPEDVRGYGP